MGLKTFLPNLISGLLDVLAPPRHTDAAISRLTSNALREIARREKDTQYAPAIHTLLPYRNPRIKALIYEMKYRRNPRAFELASELLREELLGSAEESIGMPLLIPVPMHPDRRQARGYNQTEQLCKHVMKDTQECRMPLQYAPQALERVLRGLPQQKLPRTLRLTNMKMPCVEINRSYKAAFALCLTMSPPPAPLCWSVSAPSKRPAQKKPTSLRSLDK